MDNDHNVDWDKDHFFFIFIFYYYFRFELDYVKTIEMSGIAMGPILYFLHKMNNNHNMDWEWKTILLPYYFFFYHHFRFELDYASTKEISGIAVRWMLYFYIRVLLNKKPKLDTRKRDSNTFIINNIYHIH